jgi:hypothetical protein
LSVVKGRIARFVLPVAAIAWLASALAAVLGGPRTIGLWLLVAGVIAAGLAVLAVRRARPISDNVVAELDRAAELGGSLRSAHWFAAGGQPVPPGDPSAAWLAFHLEDAASRAARVGWTKLYERPPARLSWGMAVVCVLGTLGVFAWPPPHLVMRPLHAFDAARAPEPRVPSISPSLMPQLAEGMRAMKAGRAPSQAELSAIGQALEIAKNDPAAQRQIKSLFAGSGTHPEDPLASLDSQGDSGESRDDIHNGFELADLNWALQEALARAQVDERTHPDARREANGAESTRDGGAGEQEPDPTSSGALSDVPVQADARDRAVSFSSLLLGRQQASGDASPTTHPQTPGRTATLAAVLRKEIVHSQSDVTGPDPALSGVRHATNAGHTPTGAILIENGVRYDRSRGMQPPAVPDARRSLVRSFFLRPPDTGSPVKRP